MDDRGRGLRNRIQLYLQKLIPRRKRDRLEREMEEGYSYEAASPSLDSEWSSFEAEGL